MEKGNLNYNLKKGFTLVEIMVVVAIISALIFLLSGTLVAIFKNANNEIRAMDNIYRAKSAVNEFANEIRNGIYGVDGSYPIVEAGNNEIIFFTDYRIPSGTAKRIRYFINNGGLYRGTVVASGNPLAYDTNQETVIKIVNSLANVESPIFYYYDGNYNGTGDSLSQPVNLNSIRFVSINLQVFSELVEKSQGKFLITAGSAIRSLKDNLGN